MKIHFLISCISVFLVSLGLCAQSEEDYYKEWCKQMDTITEVDSRLKLSLDMVSKVSRVYKTEIFMHLGRIYSDKRMLDSSYFYYNKAIDFGESQGEEADEFLGLCYTHLAYLLLDEYGYDDDKKKEAKTLFKKARIILNRNKDYKAWSQYYISQSYLVEKNEDYLSAIKYMNSAVIFNQRIKDSSNLATCYHNRGFLHYNLSTFEKAAKNFLLAIGLNKKLNRLSNLAGTYYVLSACYVALDQNEIAVKYSKKGCEVSKKIGYDYATSLNYSILSESYRNLNKTQNALRAVDSMLVYARKINDSGQIAQGLTDKAGIHLVNTKNFDKAEEYYLQAYKIAKSSGVDVYMSPILGGLFEVYLKKNDYPKALKFLKLQEKNIEKLSLHHPNYLHLYESYSKYYEKTGQLNLALKHLKKHYTLKDSISSEKVKTQVADLEKKYDTKNKELQLVKLDKEKKKQEQLTAEAKAKQNLYLLSAILLLSILVYWLLVI